MTTSHHTMPAEWDTHQRTFMAWPCRDSLWGSSAALERARLAYAAVARAIAGFEPVTMIARPEHAAAASTACGAGVSVAAHEIDDSWMRDTGPSFVRDGRGDLAGVQWRFNGWGGKYTPHDRDAAIASAILHDLGIACINAPLVAEGGALHVDGAGTLMTTAQCLLNANRNPDLSRIGIENLLKSLLGVRKVIWLEQGLIGDETDGHIDNVACFSAPGHVILQGCDDPGDANHAIAADNLSRLRSERDASGKPLEILQLPAPGLRRDERGVRMTLSYVNFYLVNGGLIMPGFDDHADEVAKRLLEKAFPHRQIVQLPALDIVAGGGGIHCITQQMPTP
ncbi:MAG: agmatine deiminase family protein [Alphaproteobacteria bacterium]